MHFVFIMDVPPEFLEFFFIHFSEFRECRGESKVCSRLVVTMVAAQTPTFPVGSGSWGGSGLSPPDEEGRNGATARHKSDLSRY